MFHTWQAPPRFAAAIASALRTNATLLTLDLSFNNIGQSGAASLAEALRHNGALTALLLASETAFGIGEARPPARRPSPRAQALRTLKAKV